VYGNNAVERLGIKSIIEKSAGHNIPFFVVPCGVLLVRSTAIKEVNPLLSSRLKFYLIMESPLETAP
jgi:hypothetical protein